MNGSRENTIRFKSYNQQQSDTIIDGCGIFRLLNEPEQVRVESKNLENLDLAGGSSSVHIGSVWA